MSARQGRLPGVPKRRRSRVEADKVARLLVAAFHAGYRLGYENGRYDQENGEEHNPDAGDGFEMWVFDTDSADTHKDEAAEIRALLLRAP